MIKTATRMLLVSNFLTLVLPIAAYASATTTACALKKVSGTDLNSNWRVRFGNRAIAVLGRQHLGPLGDVEKQMSEQVLTAAKSAKSKDCAGSANALKALLQNRSALLDSAIKLSADIQSTTAEFQPQSMGFEFTPAMWADRIRVSTTQLSMLKYLVAQCPDNGTLIANVAKVFPGPEYEYEITHREMTKAEPLEDPALRAKVDQTLAKFKSMSSSTILELNPTAGRLAADLMSRIKKGELISNSELSEIVKAQGAGTKADAAKSYIETYREILAFNPERNSKMADRVLADTGNYLIVIGNAHAADLANRLYERCLKSESQVTVTGGPSAVKGFDARAISK